MNYKHGMNGTPTYSAWHSMKHRCKNPSSPRFHRYGGRGIRVCERWLEFPNFLADMGVAPEGYTLERIDVNGNYEPGNCRWATKAEQMQNTRRTVFVEVDGQRVCLKEACRLRGLNYRTIQSRVNILKMSPQEAVSRQCPGRRRRRST